MDEDRFALSRRRFLAAAGATALSSTWLGSRGAASLGRVARESPNVVVLVIDTLRADYVGAYGGRAHTPNIDALARDGLRFTSFHPEAMATVPARRSILTGRRVFPFRHWHVYRGLMRTPGWAPIADPEHEAFTSVLRRHGYWTAYVTDNPFLGFSHWYAPFRATFDRYVRHGGQLGLTVPLSTVSRKELEHWLVPELRLPHIERRVHKFLAAGHAYWRDERRSWAARVYSSAARVLDEARRRQPFALVVDTFEPHEPWTPPRSYIDMYGDPRHRGPEPCMGRYERVSEWLGRDRAGPVLRRMRDLYAAEVTMTDRWLGVFMDRLHELELGSSTVVVLVSDHGYLLGEHGWTGKIASSLHPQLMRVPLIVVDPHRRRAGRTSAYFASTCDVGPTVLAMAGIRRPRHMDGVDLSPLLRDRSLPERRLSWGGYANWFYARTDRWALISDNGLRHPRLYDLARDPREARNVAERHPGKVGELSRAVLRRAGGRLPVYRQR
jgi:arylsulfatase A-like enzyme